MKKRPQKTDFINLRDVWGKHTLNVLKREHKKRLVKGLFDIGRLRKITAKITKKNIIRVTCSINIAIPCTAWPVTNPIIKKTINAFDSDKIGRKINVIKMKLRR